MKSHILFFVLFFGFVFQSSSLQAAPSFRFHLFNEPSSLRPWEQKNSSAGYFLTQVVGTLLTYQEHKLSGNLSQSCKFITPLRVRCQLRKGLLWSDGKPLTASDFVRSFQSFLDPQNHAFRADLLFPVRNAQAVYSGKLQPKDLKVSAPQPTVFEIELEKPDSEFLYTLASPLLAPLPEAPLPTVEELRKNPSLWKSSGPFFISAWEPQKKITLKSNVHFWKKGARPDLEILMISEDSVALNLYEKGELNFLRRLPTLFIPKYKNRPDYFEIEQIRFDYLGFSPKWKEWPDLRLSFAQSLRYTDLQNLFHAKGKPGCPGIPQSLHTEVICHEFQLEKAKKLWAGLKDKPAKLEMAYSRQGGDDHKRSMEWVQSEWTSQLGAKIELAGLENKIFLERLEKSTPDIFRKGVAPDRPTCLSALEPFQTGNSENYIGFSNKEFDGILEKMRRTRNEAQSKKLCDRSLHLLMDLAWIIPTGPIHFTLLAQPQWKGWKLNELNQLDLSELSWKD